MKRILTACLFFATALLAQAYDIAATVFIEGETKWYFDIELANNDIDFTAFQMDVTLFGNATLDEENLTTSELTHTHKLMLAAPGEQHYRVVGFNSSNANLTKKEGRLFSFTIDGNIIGIYINKIIFAMADGTEVEADAYLRPLNRNDEDAVKDAPVGKDVNKVVYDMEGKQVFRIDRHGLYIQNGKKIAK